MFMGVVTKERKPMPPPVDDMSTVWDLRVKMAVEQMLKYTFVGSKETIQTELTEFIDKTGADELMIASYLYDHQKRIQSHRLFAEVMKELSVPKHA